MRLEGLRPRRPEWHATLVGFVGDRGSADADCGGWRSRTKLRYLAIEPLPTHRGFVIVEQKIQWKAVIWPMSEASKLWC